MPSNELLRAIVLNDKQDKIFIAQNIKAHLDESFRSFITTGVLECSPYQEEFGPTKVSEITRFVRMLDAKIAASPKHKIVYYVESGRQHLTHAVYLLGAYMLLKHGSTAAKVSEAFAWLDQSLAAPFREPGSDFELRLVDCWVSLEHIRDLGWLRVPVDLGVPGFWGRIDADEYEHYNNPVNADLHEVAPLHPARSCF